MTCEQCGGEHLNDLKSAGRSIHWCQQCGSLRITSTGADRTIAPQSVKLMSRFWRIYDGTTQELGNVMKSITNTEPTP